MTPGVINPRWVTGIRCQHVFLTSMLLGTFLIGATHFFIKEGEHLLSRGPEWSGADLKRTSSPAAPVKNGAAYRAAARLVNGGVLPFATDNSALVGTYQMDINPMTAPCLGPLVTAIGRTLPAEAQLFLEVGSYQGVSARVIATTLRAVRKQQAAPDASDFVLVCMDTFLGAPRMLVNQIKGNKTFVPIGTDGRSRLYEVFLGNMLRWGLGDVVLPFPISSVEGLAYMHSAGLEPYFIFLDSGHLQGITLLELQAAMKVLRPGGYLFGHDYYTEWAGVKHDVHLFLRDPGVSASLQVLTSLDVRDVAPDVARKMAAKSCLARAVQGTGRRLWTSGNLWVLRKASGARRS